MNKIEVLPHARLSNEPPIFKLMAKQVLSLSREPQVLYMPTNAQFMFAALEGWKLGLWFEVRPPLNSTQELIYQLFTDGSNIPSFAQYKATVLREEIGDLRIQQPVVAWHLFEYPRGSKVRMVEE